MSLEVLQLLITVAYADNHLSDAEMVHIRAYAQKIGVGDEQLAVLINTELERIKQIQKNSINTNVSGFETTTPNQNENVSGFVTPDNPNTQQSGFVSNNPNANVSGFISNDNTHTNLSSGNAKFSEVETLQTNGAMSIIQRGKYFGKWVIIKRLRPEHRQSAKHKELFVKEFENAYHFDHPHIVRIIGKDRDNDGEFYFMEYVDGQTLTGLITPQGVVSGELIKKIMTEILQALAYVHKRQIYHRDLKPDNIMLTYKGDNVKLLDFGLAAADAFTDNLARVGTPRYAPLEQLTHPQHSDARSDIYSLGLIFLEMLTGQIDDTEKAKQRSISLYLIIKRCTHVDMTQRYNNCDELLNDISTIRIPDLPKHLTNQPITTTPPTIQPTTQTTTPPQKHTPQTTNTITPPIKQYNNDLAVVSVFRFFAYTHQTWLSGSIDKLHNRFSEQPAFSQRAKQLSPYCFLVEHYTPFVRQIFAQRHFVNGEYFVATDNRVWLLTNARAFFKTSNQPEIQVFRLFEISELEKKIQPIDRLYAALGNTRFWRTDWELTLAVARNTETTQWEPLRKTLLNANFTQTPALFEQEKITANLLPVRESHSEVWHTNLQQMVAYTRQMYSSEHLIGLYNNRYLDHEPTIDAMLPTIQKAMNDFLPFADEFFYTDTLHNGFISNFRLFYQQEQQYKCLPLANVQTYRLQKSKNFFGGADSVQITLHEGTFLTVELKHQNTLTPEETTMSEKRIGAAIALSKQFAAPDKLSVWLTLTTQQTESAIMQ